MEVKTKTTVEIPVAGLQEVQGAEVTVPVTWDEIKSTILAGNALRVKVGGLLVLMKQQLPYGTFQAACAENLPDVSYPTLSRWMNLAATNIEMIQVAASIVQVEQKKLEDLKARPGITGENITRKIEAQEAKIEKLITKMAPPVSFENRMAP